MNDKELRIFNLCNELSELLGDKEAIANLKLLYEHHPEMFKNMQEVASVIKVVVEKPDLIMQNPKAKNGKDIIVAKELNDKNMGDIGIRNDEGTNVIFHANKKGMRDFNRLKRIKERIEANGGDALSLHTPSQAWMGANVVSSTLSSASKDIIPQPNPQSQANSQEAEFAKLRAEVRKASATLNKDTPNESLDKGFEK